MTTLPDTDAFNDAEVRAYLDSATSPRDRLKRAHEMAEVLADGEAVDACALLQTETARYLEGTVNPHPETFRIETDAAEIPCGTVYIPNAFSENLSVILASLDWARVWGTRQDFRMTAQDLRQASKYARALADRCEAIATSHDNLTTDEGDA